MSGVKNPLGDIQNGRSSSTVFHLPWEVQEAKSVWWNTSLGSGEGRSFRSSIFRFYLVFLTVFVLFCMFTVLVHAYNSSSGLEFKSSPIFYLRTPVKSAMVAWYPNLWTDSHLVYTHCTVISRMHLCSWNLSQRIKDGGATGPIETIYQGWIGRSFQIKDARRRRRKRYVLTKGESIQRFKDGATIADSDCFSWTSMPKE